MTHAAGLLSTWVQHMANGYRKFIALPSEPAAPNRNGQAVASVSKTEAVDVFAESLCTYMQHAITAASSQTTGLPQAASQSSLAGHSAQRRGATASATQSAAPQTGSMGPLLAVFVADFVSAVVSSSADKQHAATAHRALKLAQSLVDALQQQQCLAPTRMTEHLLNST